MPDLTSPAMAVFRRYHGHATAAMLTDASVGRLRRARLVEEGVLTLVHERVFRIASTPDTIEARCAALCLAYPAGFITSTTSGRLLGLRRMGPQRDVEFQVPHGSNIGPIDGVRLRQTTRITAADTVLRPDGIRTASPARLGFDLAADLSEHDLASAIEQLINDRRCSAGQLAAVGRRLCHPRRPGSFAFERALLARVPGGALESDPEVVVGRVLREHGIPVEAQTRLLHLPDGTNVRLDFSIPALRWGLEVDVHPTHFSLIGGSSDRRRDRQCHLIGWQVERVTPFDLLDLEALGAELDALYRARTAALAA
jgi:hypothetical protein